MMKAIKVSGIVVAILVLLPLLIACSSSKNNNTPTPTVSSATLSVQEAATTFHEYVANLQNPMTEFETNAWAWTSATTSSQAEEDAQPLIMALEDFQTNLTITGWPSVAQANVQTLTSDTEEFIAVLHTTNTVNFLNTQPWLQNCLNALGKWAKDVDSVLKDLGIPVSQGTVPSSMP